MSRMATIFLKILVPVLAILLAWLGWQTSPDNLMGFFLLIVGLVYSIGTMIDILIYKKPIENLNSNEKALDEEKSDVTFWLILPGMIIPFFISPIEYLYMNSFLPKNNIMQILGSILVIFSITLITWARAVMKKNYSGHLKVTKIQNLVQSGPYRYIRHPAYSSYLIMTLGVSLSYSSLIGISGLLFLLLPAIIFRISVEEDLLIRRFGKDYLNYSNHTSRLIPGVW